MPTRVEDLTEAWVEVSVAANVSEAQSGKIFLSYGTAPPAANTRARHVLDAQKPTQSYVAYSGTENTYARAFSGFASIVVTDQV